MIPKELLITSQDLVDWIDRPPSNDDLDLCNYLENAVKNQYKYKNVIDKIKEYIKTRKEEYNNETKLSRACINGWHYCNLMNNILELLEEVE